VSWFARCLRLIVVCSAAFLIVVTTTADASRGRLKAAGAAWLAHGRLITFTGRYGYGSERTWIMNADGSGKRPLRGDVPSPSARRLASSGDTGTEGVVWVGWLSGRTIRNFRIHVVADLGFGWPLWAPDERAVEVGVDDHAMFVAQLHGALRLISRVRSRSDMSPAWSPDSRSIAFITCAERHEWKCDLARIRPDGSGRRVLVHNIIPATQSQFESGVDVQPAWSPNGSTIAFAVRFGDVREQKAPSPRHGRVLASKYGIYVVRPDGTGLRRVAATPYTEELSEAPALAWSANNDRIAFADSRGITIVDVTDGSQYRLTSLPRDMPDDNGVSWAPSTHVLFSHRGNVYTVIPGQRLVRILP
jgi:WD40-like Beta Propeller Repeat